MTGHVIKFSPSGQAEAMHSDKFSLAFLGRQTIQRASELKFNERTQKWDIWLVEGEFHTPPRCEWQCGFDTYDESRKAEVLWLNSCRLEGCDPLSHAGIHLLRAARGIRAGA